MVTYSNSDEYDKDNISNNNNNLAAITSISSSSSSSNDYYAAFAYQGKEISQTLNRAQFLPLTGNNQSHQVKVTVNYSVTDPSIVNQNMNAIIHVYAANGTLVRSSSFGHGFIINSTSGQTRLATTITDNTVRNVKAIVMLSNATKNANFSNPLSIDLNLGQKIPP
jgi:hypothetical protein